LNKGVDYPEYHRDVEMNYSLNKKYYDLNADHVLEFEEHMRLTFVLAEL
jgi:hypothetical protein